MKKENTPKPTRCGECICYQAHEYNATCIFDCGDEPGVCKQSNMKVYRYDVPCPCGILKYNK